VDLRSQKSILRIGRGDRVSFIVLTVAKPRKTHISARFTFKPEGLEKVN
jgi:hypothetical protein